MPKVLALFFGADSFAATVAEGAAEGAKSVRFTEVDVHAGGAADTQHRRVASAHAVSHYDGLVIVSTNGHPDAELATFLDDLQREARVANMVFGLAGGDPTLLARVARLGGLIVSVPNGGDAQTDARGAGVMLGARVAKVAGWVRHALGHEAEHSHS